MNELANQLVEWHARAPRPFESTSSDPALIMKDDELDHMVRVDERLCRNPPAAEQVRRPTSIPVVAAPDGAHKGMPAAEEFVNPGTPQAEEPLEEPVGRGESDEETNESAMHESGPWSEAMNEVLPTDEVLPDDDTMVTMAWQAMARDGKRWLKVPEPTAQQLRIIANNDYVTRHVPGDEDLPVDAFGEPSAEQLQDIANNDIATAIDWRNIAAMDVDDFNSPLEDF